MAGQQQKAHAFGYQLFRVSPEGYEVDFQRIDPVSGAPLPFPPVAKFFPRGRSTSVTLSDDIQVTGFYGDPTIKTPPWQSSIRLSESLVPSPLLARPRAVYYPQGTSIEVVPVPAVYEAVLENHKELRTFTWGQHRFATPMSQFKKRLYDQIGAAWYRRIQANSAKVPVGTVRIALTLSPEGKIRQLRILSNTSNQLCANICLKAIRQAKIPPLPTELLARGNFEDEITFTVYPK